MGDSYNKDNTDKNAKITVHGDNTVGIYAQSFTEKQKNADGNIITDADGSAKNIFGKNEKESVITNNGDILLTGNGSVGIYADNNNGVNALNDYNTDNKINVSNAGTITVGGILTTGTGESEKQTSSIGILGKNINISNTGTITAGCNHNGGQDDESAKTGAVGIYAEKSKVTNIGNIVLGDYATGVYVDKDSTITNATDVVFQSLKDNTTTRVGIMLDGDAQSTTLDTLNFNINMSDVVGGKAVVAKNRNVIFGNDTADEKTLTISGQSGRGIRVSDGTATNKGIITLTATGTQTASTGSIGMLAIDKNGKINNSGKISIDSNCGVGVYIDNQRSLGTDKGTASGNTVENIGNINLNSEHATGVVLKGTGQINVNEKTFGADGITFGTNAEKSVGVYADGSGAVVNVSGDVIVELDDNNKNALLYAENGATITNDGNITIKGKGDAGSGSVGVYLGAGGQYTENGTLKAEHGAIGLYGMTVKVDGTTETAGNISINNANVTVDSHGVNTIGIVMAGTDKTIGRGNLAGTVTLTNTDTNAVNKNQSTGVYVENTNLTLGDLTVNHGEVSGNTFTNGSNGTAVYVGTGASVNSGILTLTGQGAEVIENGTTTTPRSIGIYYNTDSTVKEKSSTTELAIEKSNTSGIYLAEGMKLTQTGGIEIRTGAKNTVGAISLGESSTNKNTLIFGNNNINILGEKNIGLAGANTDITSNGTITIEDGSISGTGVLLGAGSTFSNEGTINVNEKGETTHLGVGIYMNDGSELTKAGTIKVAEKSAAVYTSGNVKIKSDINIADSEGAIGLVAGKGTVVNGDKRTDTTVGEAEKSVITIGAKATGVYSLGGTIIENIKVTSEDMADNIDKKLTMGMYLASDANSSLSHDIKNSEISLKEGIGITTASSADGITNDLNLSGTKITIDSKTDSSSKASATENSETGIGIYLGTNSSLVSGGKNTFDITNGIGIYGKEGSAIEIGATDENSKDVVNLKGYSLGVYADKGTITIGEYTDVTIADGAEGSLVYGINSNIANNADITAVDSKNFMGLFTKYTNDGNLKSLENYGDITILGEQSYGIVAINGTWKDGISVGDEDSQPNIIINKGNITVNGTISETGSKLSAGIYTEGSSIENSGIIKAGDSTVGVAYKNLSKKADDTYEKHNITLNSENGQIILAGRRGVGVSLEGAAGSVSIGNIAVDTNTTNNTSGNLGLYLNKFSADSFSVDEITLGDSSLGIYAKDTGNLNSKLDLGKINIEAGDNSIGIAARGNSYVKLEVISDVADNQIIVGAKGTGLYVSEGSTIEINNLGGIKVGAEGVLAHADGGTIKMTDLTTDKPTISNYIGFIVSGKDGNITAEGANTKLSGMIVTDGGVGMVIRGEGAKRPDIIDNQTTIILGKNENSDTSKYSVGLYYQNAGELANNFQGIKTEFTTDTNRAVGIVFDRTYGEITYNDAITIADGKDNIGIIVRRDEVANDTENQKEFTLNSSISVSGEGNIGLAGKNSIINMTGNIETAEGKSGDHYPIGVYLLGETEQLAHDFTQTGDITVGKNSTGIYGKNYNITINDKTDDGTINVSAGGIGIFAESDENHTADKLHSVTVGGKDIIVANSENDTDKTVGIYGKNNNIKVDLAGNMEVGNNGSIGVYSLGNGNVDFIGDVKLAGGIYGQGSYGIYKTDFGNDGTGIGSTGTIIVNKGTKTWDIGDYSYGIIARAGSRDSRFAINNNADMTLGTSAIGIASFGINTLTNTGNIIVGEASLYESGVNQGETNPSVGIYMGNGFGNGTAQGTNKGTISVNSSGSTGIYALGYVNFDNQGTINISDKGTGILAGAGAHITNTLSGIIDVSGEDSVGIRAEGGNDTSGKTVYTTVDNYGTIKVSDGATGVIIHEGAVFNHHKNAELTIDGTSYGVRGEGTFNNEGHVTIAEGGKLHDETIDEKGSAIVVTDTEVILNKNYRVSNGILDTGLNVKADGMVVDISEGKGIGINAPDISGNVTLDSKFALTGNGINYKVEDFINSGKVNVDTSRLYKTNIDENGTLHVLKDSYANVMNNDRFVNFYNAMDSHLEEAGSDAEILKGMNFYLNNLGQSNLFDREAQRITSEMQGDIYGTVQSRMRDINKAFDNSFDEMAEAYNPAVHNNKISLIQGYGESQNSNYDMIDYDYTITGVQYMQQYQGLDSNNKYGVHFGFAVSQFEFDDFGSSEEDVYSLRAGAHNIQKFENGMTLLSKAEIGYNRHDVERKVNYGYSSYTNDTEFNSYEVSIDNKLSKDLYKDDAVRVGVYTGLNLEYGRFDDIDESGNMAIKVKSNDYISSKAMFGFDGSMTAYLENDWAVELKGDIGYSYDFGENYEENKAKVKGEKEGYYSLLSDVETRGEAGARVGVAFKKSETMAVTLEGEYTKDFERDENYWKAGLRFTYKFNSDNSLAVLRNPMGFLESHFDFDSDSLENNEIEAIQKTSEIINKKKVKGTLVIEGHADSTGKENYNQTLSEKRAKNVENEFKKNIKKAGNIQYDVKGYGETKPAADNNTSEGRAANRRVNVKFIDKR